MKLSDLLTYDSIAIQCHNIPDADSLASGFGLYRYFRAAGKKTLFFYGGPPITKPNLLFMIEAFAIPVQHLPDLKKCNGLLITVDCQHGNGNVAKVTAPHVAVIDHHIQEKELPPLCDLRPWLGSCATMVWDLLRKEAFPMDKGLSTALHYGLFTDTNGFSEVRHPLDRDMWDALVVDESILKRLKLSNLSLNDLSQVSTALNNLFADQELRFALIPAPPCDPNILGFISDLAMQVDTVDLAIAYSSQPSGDIKFSVRTATREAKASELASWIAQGLGSGGGHREKAGGYVAATKYHDSVGNTPFLAYCQECVRDYCHAFKVLDCLNPQSIQTFQNLAHSQAMATYRKLPVLQGFVRCSDLFDHQAELQLRMLEGDMDIIAGEDTILMIGITGEVYHMEKAVFERNYQPLNEPYAPDFCYSPTVLNKGTGKRVSLSSHARSCLSTGTSTVEARCLNERVKVFTRWGADDYLTGLPGDWLVARAPDDFYIVTAPIFPQLYVPDLTHMDLARDPNALRVSKRAITTQVTFATEAGSMKTLEGEVSYEQGDALVTGVLGESWPISRQRFNLTYQPDKHTAQGSDGCYYPISTPVWAKQINSKFSVALPGSKGILQGKAEDWLIQYTSGDQGIVDNALFEKIYQRLDPLVL